MQRTIRRVALLLVARPICETIKAVTAAIVNALHKSLQNFLDRALLSCSRICKNIVNQGIFNMDFFTSDLENNILAHRRQIAKAEQEMRDLQTSIAVWKEELEQLLKEKESLSKH